ncbi:response regulator [Nonomuraea endophytica]|uniref:DNA-binding NarL/FixJ family response regulator n=1 Tax=Nonomuraea endophytica TaxID=714136 RepID=A0A7W8A5L5_9ACTN|nr:response regulator transcription factor [Nonomuraea endophytica]MBB5079965.1 DNA-binding NarL/FixJ family response regulator [Nonomuraea endophytica]
MTIRVLVADDQPAVRRSFRTIIDAQPDLEVVGEAPDGVAALELAAELAPDVVVADIRMPRMDGLELTRRLSDTIRVIVVTTYDLDEYVHTALRSGACGFLLKHAGAGLLAEGIRAAAAGDALISPSVTVRLLRHLTPAQGRTGVAGETLSDRELEIVRLVAQGRSNPEIGAELFISAGTAKTHVANVQRKLGVRNRVGIAAWAWENGHA